MIPLLRGTYVLAAHWLIVAQEAGCRLGKPFYQMALSDYELRTPSATKRNKMG